MAIRRYCGGHDWEISSLAAIDAIEDAKLHKLKTSIVEHSDPDIPIRLDHLRNGALGNADCLSQLRLSSLAPKEIS
ncbi:hypothetical protein PSCICL_45670 [Pseudomonas cichorii]|nr:hypothetical protein PSCICL_45670 [Pseudomonas cichorii]